MWPFILLFIVFVVVFTLIVYFLTRWASKFVQRQIAGRLDAINRIVNEQGVPEPWLAPYRRRASKLVAGGATDAQIHSLSNIARKRSLANIEELIRFVEARKLTDTEATKRLMLRSLREEAERWRDEATWQEIVDLTAPPPDTGRVEEEVLDDA